MIDFASLPKMQLSALVALEDDPFFQILFEAHSGNSKLPLKPSEVMAIYEELCKQGNLRDLVLFTRGIDIMYRCSDILTTRRKDVQDSQGNIIKYHSKKQQKTKNPSCSVLKGTSRLLLERWLDMNQFQPHEYIFPGKYEGTHLGDRRYRDIVKEWVAMIGLPIEFYSTHTLRKTKSMIMYMVTKDVASIQKLLGQKSLTSTLAYLGVEVAQALYLSNQFDFFDESIPNKYGILTKA